LPLAVKGLFQTADHFIQCRSLTCQFIVGFHINPLTQVAAFDILRCFGNLLHWFSEPVPPGIIADAARIIIATIAIDDNINEGMQNISDFRSCLTDDNDNRLPVKGI